MGGRRPATIEKMASNVDSLIRGWSGALKTFENRGTFSGPSVYFHAKAIRSRGGRRIAALCRDSAWLECVYATLTAWGMHRMGPTGAKLVDFEDFEKRAQSCATYLEALEDLRLCEVDPDDAAVPKALWKIIELLSASATGTQIVAGSKVVHHLLPDLMPPIDRQYTMTFLYGTKPTTLDGKAVFMEVFQAFAKIANARQSELSSWKSSGHPMDTNPTKRLDNAIVGFVLKRYGAPEDE